MVNTKQPQALEKHISDNLVQEPPCNLKEMYRFLGAAKEYWLIWHKEPICLNLFPMNLTKNHFFGSWKWIKPSNNWKQSWLWMSSCISQPQYPFPYLHWCFWLSNGCHSHPTQMTCCILVQKVDWHQTKLPFYGENCSPLSWFLKHFPPCSLVPNSSFILITKFLPFPTLTVTASSAGSHLKEYCHNILYHLDKRMWLLIHFPRSNAMMCCQFQRERMFLLSSLILFLKALTSVMTLNYSSAF